MKKFTTTTLFLLFATLAMAQPSFLTYKGSLSGVYINIMRNNNGRLEQRYMAASAIALDSMKVSNDSVYWYRLGVRQFAGLFLPDTSTIYSNLALKVDKVTGKVLSTNDYDNTEKSANTANTAARHTHSNKTTLDAVTAAYTTAEQTKLSGIATGATANSSDATLLNRVNHTGTQTASTISNFQTTVSANTDVAASVTHAARTDNPHTVTASQLTSGTLPDARLSSNVSLKANLAVVNAADAGFVGDGATDNSATFNSWITSATAGTRLVFGPGEYKFRSAVTLTKAVSLIGAGPTRYTDNSGFDFDAGTKFTYATTTPSAFLTIASTNTSATFRGSVVEGIGMRDSVAGQDTLLNIKLVNNFRVINSSFAKGLKGILVNCANDDASWGVIENCIFPFNGVGVDLTNGGGSIPTIEIKGGMFGVGAGQVGIKNKRGQYVSLSGFKMDVLGDSATGIEWNGGTKGQIVGVKMEITSPGANNRGIKINPSGTTAALAVVDLAIIGCTMTSAGTVGTLIDIDGGTTTYPTKGVKVIGGAYSAGGTGIHLGATARNNLISGVSFANHTTSAITLDAGGVFNVLRDISNDRAASAAGGIVDNATNTIYGGYTWVDGGSSGALGTLLVPMVTAMRDAISSPKTGSMIFNTTTGKQEYYDGAAWQQLGSPFVATGSDLYYNTGGISIGKTSAPTYKLDVNGSIGIGSGLGTQYGNDNMIKPVATSAYLNLKGGAGNAKVTIGNDHLELSAGIGETTIYRDAGVTTAGTAAVKVFRTTGNVRFQNGGTLADSGSRVQIAGSIALGYSTRTANSTLNANDCIVEITTQNTTQNLPTAVGIPGRIYTIKQTVATGTTTITPNGAQTIDGSASYSLSAQNKYVTLMSNGANWLIIAAN